MSSVFFPSKSLTTETHRASRLTEKDLDSNLIYFRGALVDGRDSLLSFKDYGIHDPIELLIVETCQRKI